MKTYVSLLLLFLCFNNIIFSLVNSLECRYCSSSEYSSDCRKGTVEDLKTCTLEGEDHCYVEYILNKGKKPLYRRGCAPGNWCQQQVKNHNVALKFCNTCQGSKCNNDTIGSEDSSSFLCRSCESEKINSDCAKGTISTTDKCAKGEMCLQYHVSTTRRNIFIRDCGDSNSCTELEKMYGHSIRKCNTCKYELCNNNPLN